MGKMKKIFSIILVMLFSFCIPVLADTTTTTLNNMKIHYIDVGQGDSELIQVDGKNILIDAGTSDNKALNYLKSIGITTLDYVIATHPHEDHIGAMDDVINNFNIGTFYAPQVTQTTKTFENMIDALKAKNLKITVPKTGDNIVVGNATLTFLAPNSATYEDLNNYSIVCKLKYGNTSFIFTGDAESVSESEILAKQLDIQANVLKIGHHGSTSSTTQAFLDKVNPQYAVISCGKDNDYGHPHKETIDKLNAKSIKIFRTDMNGTIIANSNGQTITFNTNLIKADIKPITAKSEWKSDSKGWWYTEGNSWATGWRQINGVWYYFYSDGYMAHDTTIEGFYLNSSGARVSSKETNTISNNYSNSNSYVNTNGQGLIKGSKSHIYHVPGSKYYDKTTNVVQWFKTIEEAEAAGYRAPKE